jgi:sugar-specific transcriptional regulator TrmB
MTGLLMRNVTEQPVTAVNRMTVNNGAARGRGGGSLTATTTTTTGGTGGGMSMADDSSELVLGLQGFGLTEYESRVYYTLLSNGACTVNQIQYASGVPRTKVYQVSQQLTRKGLLREVDGGKPSRFEAQPPEALQSILVERERKVRTLRKSMVALKKVREKNINPGDVFEERYLSLGSQSLLMKLKESILKAEKEVKCIVDNWGLQLIQECVEEVESACRHDAEVRIVASLAEAVPEFPFSSPRLKLRFGRHLVGKSVFIIDNSELILVNSQTGRGYQILLSELRSAIGDELFEGVWKGSTSSRAIPSLQLFDGLPILLDPAMTRDLFVEAVARVMKDEDAMMESIGEELVGLLETRVSSKVTRQPLEATVKFMLAMMRQELGEDVTSTEYDPLTKIARIELPDNQGAVPASIWYFALAGMLKRTGTANELLQVTAFPETRSRIIQRRFAGVR